MELGDADLGLLLALEALLRERNVTRAARRLGISQSTLSSRLGRLRTWLGDPLFVPAVSGRGVVPTPRAAALEGELAAALSVLRELARPPGAFDPATTARTFVIGTHERPALMLGPGLVRTLVAVAPGARLALVLPGADGAARLEAGELDLLITGTEPMAPGLRTRRLLSDAFGVLQRRAHPRGTGPLGLDEYCALDHLLVSAQGGGFSSPVDAMLAELGRRRRVVASVQSYALAPLIVAATDCLCTLPRRMLAGYAALVDVLAVPLVLPQPELMAVWHARSQRDPGHTWLRELLYEVAEGVEGAA